MTKANSTAQPVVAEPGQSRYAALAQSLRARVVSGEWAPGAALPSEQLLAQQHGVALGTLRQALALLSEQGLVERVHGKGTFVRGTLSGASLLRFFRFGRGTGEVPQSRILRRQRLALPTDVARAMGLAPGEGGLRLQRLRDLEDRPCLLEDIWLPLAVFEALADKADDPAGWPPLLYPLYAERCGVHVNRAVDHIAFGVLSAGQAELLALPPSHPCVIATRCAYDLAGRCVEYRETRGDAYAFQYTVNIT